MSLDRQPLHRFILLFPRFAIAPGSEYKIDDLLSTLHLISAGTVGVKVSTTLTDFGTMSGYTFGVEIECILLVSAEYGEDTQYGIMKLVQAELSRPFHAKCRVPDCKIRHSYNLPLKDSLAGEYGYTKWQVKDDVSVKLTRVEELSKEWQLCDDGYIAYSVEVISRVLNLDGYTRVPNFVKDEHGPVELHWKDEIAHVCERLDSFNMEPDFRCFVNKTTGLHVHLGKGKSIEDEIRIPYRVTRGLACMFTAFERQIDSVFNTKRIAGYSGSMKLPSVTDKTASYQFNGSNSTNAQEPTTQKAEPFVTDPTAEYTYPMSRMHLVNLESNKSFIGHTASQTRGDVGEDYQEYNEEDLAPLVADQPQDQSTVRELAKTSQDRFPFTIMEGDSRLQSAIQRYDVPSWLYLLYCTNNYQELEAYWPGKCAFKNSAVNVGPLFPDQNRDDKTVEIRAHPGSIDVDEICAWVDVVGSMAKMCDLKAPSYMSQFFLKNWIEFTFLDLVRGTGCSEETQAHYQSKLEDPNYATSQRDLLTSRQNQTMPIAGFYRFAQEQRCIERDRRGIDERIRQKFESGLYGQFPYSFVVEKLGVDLAHSAEGRRLIMKGGGEEKI